MPQQGGYLGIGNALRQSVRSEGVPVTVSRCPCRASLAPERIYYQIGNIQFWYREYEQAADNLKKAAAGSSALDINTSMLAWMRLGQVYDLTNRRNLAMEAYKKAIAFAPQAEAAKESRRYLSTPYRRDG